MERGTFQTLDKYTFKADDDWGCYNEEGKYLKGSFDKDGYNRHNFRCTDGKKHTLREHNMKWECFYGKIPDDKVIDHIIPISNGGTNKLSNLRCVTPKENANNPLTKKNISKALKGKYTGEKHWMFNKRHSIETIKKMSKWRSENQFGDKNPMYGKHWNEKQREAVLKALSKKVKEIRKDGTEIIHASAAEAARQYGFDYSSISKAAKGKYRDKGHLYKNSNWYLDE